MGLSFVINIGIGMALGCLLPLVFQHADKIMTPFGLLTLIGTSLSVVGLVISNHAGMLRDYEKHKLQIEKSTVSANKNGNHKLGLILAIIAGITSSGQNFVFSLTYDLQTIAKNVGATDLGASTIIWPAFMLCAFIPYAMYTLYLHGKNKSFVNYRQTDTIKYFLFILVMGLCWYGSVLLYSKASKLMGSSLGPLICWPILMVLIILVSNFWGWKHKEWEGCGNKAKKLIKQGLLFLVLSIIVLSCSSIFSN